MAFGKCSGLVWIRPPLLKRVWNQHLLISDFVQMESRDESNEVSEPVSTHELNSWRRGFTPQAAIWNGRMAMIGLAIAFCSLLLLGVFGQ